MKNFYQAAAKILIENQIQFTYKVGECGSKKSAYITCSLFDVTPDHGDPKKIWIETSSGRWISFGPQDKTLFTSFLKLYINEQI